MASAALARLDAVQSLVLHLYREKELGLVMRHTDAEFVLVPSVWKGFDYTAMATGLAESMDPAPTVLSLDALPEGDPSVLPIAPSYADGEEPARAGSTPRPAPPRTRRACSTPTAP